MRIIAIEEHLLPRDVTAIVSPKGSPLPPELVDPLDDVGQGRLDVMDAAGIDVQVLSLLGHGVQQLKPAQSVAVSRDVNDRLAAAVKEHPGRFAAFATLPMSAPDAAGAELQRAVTELGLVGAMVHGQTNGIFLDDPSAAPVLAAADELEVPIYLHPAPPPPAVREAYFSGLRPEIAQTLATNGWGWHAECGMHVLRMVVNGVFDRYRRLQLLVGHMGENLPFSLARADERLTPVATQLSRTVGETVRQHVHITTSGYTTTPPLLCALMVFGADRMLFSVDHPFADSLEATAFLRDAPISATDREKIGHGNAERLLCL